MNWKRIAISVALVAGLAAVPLSPALAWHHHRGFFPLFWPFAAAGAVVGTAGAIATAPVRAVVGPPAYYYPPPGPNPYYSPYAASPSYYTPPPGYAPPPGYYGYPYYR